MTAIRVTNDGRCACGPGAGVCPRGRRDDKRCSWDQLLADGIVIVNEHNVTFLPTEPDYTHDIQVIDPAKAVDRPLAANSVREAAKSLAPIPMLLYCPMPGCGARHIDVGEFATKPHHTHSCQSCGMTWRPAVVHTVGVQYLPGFKNGADAQPRASLSFRTYEQIVAAVKAGAKCPHPDSTDSGGARVCTVCNQVF